jgi:hypothetical protein
LLRTAFRYLKSLGIDANLSQVRVSNRWGMVITEPVISLKGSHIDRISLSPLLSLSCSTGGNYPGFHFRVDCNKKGPQEMKDGILANIKKGPEGPKWAGGKLADILNQDEALRQGLQVCQKAGWNIDFQIDSLPSHEIYISGASFTNPSKLYSLFLTSTLEKTAIECGFGFQMAEKIAGHIQKFANQRSQSVITKR